MNWIDILITSIFLVYNRNVFGWGLRLFGFGSGALGGGIYGVISSTEYTLRR